MREKLQIHCHMLLDYVLRFIILICIARLGESPYKTIGI